MTVAARHSPAPDDTAPLLVAAGRLWDGTGKAAQPDTGLVIRAGRVDRVAPLAELRDWSGPRLDAAGRTVMPGLMDLHVHLVSVVDPDEPNAIWAEVGARTQLLTLHAAKNARLMLEAGFTTVRDLAGPINPLNLEVLALRRAVAIGLVSGPRIFAAGWVGQTGGHSDLPLPDAWPRDESVYADGPWAVRRLVRAEIRLGVDLFKTSASGGAAGHKEELWWRNYTAEELAALVDEAHAVGKRVAVHSHTAEATKRALRAGVDTIEHGGWLDDVCIEEMVKRRTWYVPTFAVYRWHATLGPPFKQERARAMNQHHIESFQRALKAGVRIAMGTDAGGYGYGDNGLEPVLMVEAGMTPAQAIEVSTRRSAECMGIADEVGTLARGKEADLIVLDADPLADIGVLREAKHRALVMKGGVAVTGPLAVGLAATN